MTTRKELENLSENSGSKTAAALAYLLGYGHDGFFQLHMNCRTEGAKGASATALFAFLDDNPSIVEAMVEKALENGVDSEGEEITDEECEECGEEFNADGTCNNCDDVERQARS